jgi:acetyl esterase/lipase
MMDRRELMMGGGALALSLRAQKLCALAAPAPSSYPVQMQTLQYASPNGQALSLDLYLPQGAPSPLPVIVFVHGGGWGGGSRTAGPDFKRFFAQDGIAIASIDYRLTPAITFPKNVEDVKTAVRWLRAHADTYGLDARRVGLWGTSAGGHLVAVAALSRMGQFEGEDNLDQSSAVQCVLDAYGPTFFALMDQQTDEERSTLQALDPKLLQWMASHNLRPFAEQHHDPADSPESKLVGGPVQSVPERVRAASPLTYVGDQAPPFLILHGLADNSVPHHQSILLYEGLAGVGKDVTLRLVDGLPHGFVNYSGIDEGAGPFRMHVRRHRDGGLTEWSSIETANVFDVSREFFHQHLLGDAGSA